MSGVGENLDAERGQWNFKDINHNNFEEHVSKSVPGYENGHQYISFLSDYFVNSNSIVYDIGCSTGNLISKLSDYNKKKDNIKFVGIDSVDSFEDQYKRNTISKDHNPTHKFEFINDEIQNIELTECDLVVSYYTIQFISPRYRQEIINNIYNKLNWGSGFFFFEKVRGIDARFNEMINLAYLEYKASMGYTNDQIISKMLSLKGVLEPYTTTENFNFLERAGFKDKTIIYKNLCFEGILAIK